MKDIADLVSFKAPTQHKVQHELRDTDTVPVNSIMTDIRYEARMTASESHYRLHSSCIKCSNTEISDLKGI